MLLVQKIAILVQGVFQLAGNVFVYGLLRGLARNLANKNRIENPRGFS